MIEGTQPDIYDLLAEDEPVTLGYELPAVCPRCDRRHSPGRDTTVAGPRFDIGAMPYAYRADYDGAPTRMTREQAMQDMCDHHTTHTTKEHRA